MHQLQQDTPHKPAFEPKTRFPGPVQGARRQLRAFTQALFAEGDLIELRMIESWKDGTRTQTDLLDRCWLRAREIPDAWPRLFETNTRGANIYFGVNPRTERSGRKQAVTTVRSVWADFDDVDLDEARDRWLPHLPQKPSMVVASGHGIHAYWLLRRPFVIRGDSDRTRFEAMLKSLYRRLCCDSVQDVSRVLRFPGFWNVKGYRSGMAPVRCTLISIDAGRKYPFAAFSAAWQEAKSRNAATQAVLPAAPTPRAEVCELLGELDRDVPDRSTRDFAIIIGLLRSGLTPEQIRPLVCQKSKFQNRPDYFDITVKNALTHLSKEK